MKLQIWYSKIGYFGLFDFLSMSIGTKFLPTLSALIKNTKIRLTLHRVIMVGGQRVVGLPLKQSRDVEGNSTLCVFVYVCVCIHNVILCV